MTDTETPMLVANLPIRRDPWYMLCMKAMDDSRYERVRDEIIAGNRELELGYQHYNMDGGPFFHDTRTQSIITAPATAITLATTSTLLHKSSLIAVPTGYFIAGKKLRMTVFGTFTTILTPGNLTVELRVGTTDAGGTLIATSAVAALIASQTTQTFIATAYFKCNGGAVEEAKPVEGYATWSTTVALITAANQAAANPIPLNAPAAVNIDNTLTTLGVNIQVKRSGSSVDTFTCRDLTFEALT